jgi:TolB-like protein/Tfp pilus assembly protein PilF
MANGERPPLNPKAVNAVSEQQGRRLDSWKEIAVWFDRSEKTVRRWEEREGMPVHRQLHDKRGSVYAYPEELRNWRESRQLHDTTETELPDRQVHDHPEIRSPALDGMPEGDSASTTEEPRAGPPQSPRWRATLLISVFLVVVVLLAEIFGGSLRELILRRTSPIHINSLAVLPLENLSGDREQEYFADGMTAELITELGKISSLRVISRTSVMRYKSVRKPLAQIARELGVDAVVEGEVLRSHDRVRVTAQLIDIAEDRHIWAESYDRDLRDVVALQGDVAQSIANAIRARVTPAEFARITPNRRVDSEAYEAYLKGRFFFEKRTSEGIYKGLEYFQQAIRKDPRYAEAYAGLAMTYQNLGSYEMLPAKETYPKAREAADKALQLNGALSEAYTARGLVSSMYEWDWNAAEQDFQSAFLVNSNDATAHHWYAEHLVNIGHADRAIAELERARGLDPLSLPINATLGRAYRDARRYQESIDQCKKTLDLDPDFAMAHWCLGVSYVAEKRYAEAITEMQRANDVGESPIYTYGVGYAYAAAGNKVKARAVIDALKQRADQTYMPAYFIAAIYGALDEKDQAFAWLQRAYDERDPQITYLLLDPFVDPLRSDPRFNALVRKVGFPL